MHSKWVLDELQSCGKRGLSLHREQAVPPRPAHVTRGCCSSLSSEKFLLNTLCPTLLCTSLVRSVLHPCVLLGPLFCLTFGEVLLTFLLAQSQVCGVVLGWVLRLAGLPCKQQCSRWKHRKEILQIVKQPWLSEWPQIAQETSDLKPARIFV